MYQAVSRICEALKSGAGSSGSPKSTPGTHQHGRVELLNRRPFIPVLGLAVALFLSESTKMYQVTSVLGKFDQKHIFY